MAAKCVKVGLLTYYLTSFVSRVVRHTSFGERIGEQLLQQFVLRHSQNNHDVCRECVSVLLQKTIHTVQHLQESTIQILGHVLIRKMLIRQKKVDLHSVNMHYLSSIMLNSKA